MTSTGAKLKGNFNLESSSAMLFKGNSMIRQLPPETIFPQGVAPVPGILSGSFNSPIGNDAHGSPVFYLQSRSAITVDATASLEE